MSTLIVRCLCPHYEDYDPYGIERNAVQGVPELWEPERHAEGALWEEHKRMREEYAMWRRYNQLRRELRMGDTDDEEVNEHALPTLVRALISIAKENDWKGKNQEFADLYGISTIYAIPPLNEDEEMPTRWNDIVRWLDRQKTKQEQEEADAEAHKAEREEQRSRDNRITIDYDALTRVMGDMMPPSFTIEFSGKPMHIVARHSHLGDRKELTSYVCALLAEENGWERTPPEHYSGKSIYKIV